MVSIYNFLKRSVLGAKGRVYCRKLTALPVEGAGVGP